MTDKWNVLGATLDGFSATASDNMWMILVFGLLGGFTFLLQRSRGALGFGKILRKFANSEKKTLMIGWVLGIIVFMDDYLNILTVSASLRETCDKYKSPREMLAYVIDSTGAPVCVLIPLSTWAVFYAGVVGDEAGMAAYGSGMDIYVQSLPVHIIRMDSDTGSAARYTGSHSKDIRNEEGLRESCRDRKGIFGKK